MKKLPVILFLIITVQIQAQVRTGEREAYTTAERFLSQQGKSYLHTISEEIKSQTSGQTNLFVFSLEPQGFVIVSALGEVLAYSFESSLPHSEKLPEHIAYWLELYNRQTDNLLEHPGLARKPSKGPKSVEPLLTSAWGQGCYYNAMCPTDAAGPCNHVEAGCVAVAMAQIMYCHKQPTKGHGAVTYSSNYGTLSANFGQTNYQWEQMVDTLHQNNSSVARLISQCGISVQMNYTPHGSLSSPYNALTAFRQFFSYPSATLLRRTIVSDEEWINQIKSDLDRHLPLLYTGESSLGKHAFVCDGYDNNGLFHFNFGWEGLADGYYTIDDPSGFSSEQVIIHDILPASDIPIHCDNHNIIYVSPDGTGDGSSWEEATNNLEAAIFKAQLSNLSIWVEEGYYSGNPLKENAFQIMRACKLYGGFKGDEPFDFDLSQRNLEVHPSILDGSQVQRVISAQNLSQNDLVIIDGFTIQNGIATHGGGLFITGRTVIKNCKISHNYATSKGGGVYSSGDEQTFWNCLINNNTASTGGGCSLGSSNRLYNCTIVKNEAQHDYGGVDNSQSPMSNTIKNCIIWGNVSTESNAQIGPSDYYSSCAVQDDLSEEKTNFITEAENDGESPNFYVRFVNADVIAGNTGHSGDWRLQPNSLCIDRVKRITGQPSTDLEGNPRLNHGNVDLGAYESNVAAHFINAYYCENDPFYYQDSLLSALGFYTFLNQSNPIDSLAVIQIQDPWEDTVYLTEKICENDTYDFFGTTLHRPGIYTATHNCISYKLDLYIKPLNTIHLQKEICEGETYDFYGIPIQESGRYYTTRFCDSILLDLTATPVPSLQCSNDTLVDYGIPIQLTASGAESYLWSTGDTTSTITVCPSEDQIYIVTGYMNKQCSDTASVTVRVNKNTDDLMLYPNPANDKTTINLSQICEVSVFNLFGERVAHINADQQPVELDVSQFASGVYIVQVRQLSNYYYKKLIIRHI